ncbi:MAG: helix-turn-helix transcriptional regulator [Ruminococcaceae bacterium]|nr:helix-turn-helix transcriptional regulator [Oscillospiraceae bacterium]
MPYIKGRTIKELRENKNLTQKQLGEIISVSDKTVSKWETEISHS